MSAGQKNISQLTMIKDNLIKQVFVYSSQM